MTREFEFRFDESLIRAGLRRDYVRRGYILGAVLLGIALCMRVANGFWDPWITSFCVGGAGFLVWRFHALWRKAATQVHEMWLGEAPGGTVRYELDDTGFDVVLEESRSRFEWADMRRLLRYDDVWLIEIMRMQSVFFPPDQVAEDVRDYVVERCTASGVRV